jgi:uncharacterized protein (DUF1778 family)
MSERAEAPRPRAVKEARVALRVSHEQRALLDEASRAEGTSLSEFLLQAATRRAEDVLAERRRFSLDAEQWAELVELLDRPAADRPRLARLLAEPSVFDADRPA